MVRFWRLIIPMWIYLTLRSEVKWSEVKWSELTQSCPTLWDPRTVAHQALPYGILQARILEWVAISFSRGTSQPRDRTQVSCIVGRRFTLWATREALVVYADLNSNLEVVLCKRKRKKERKKVKSLSSVRLFAIPWTVSYQGPPSMGFSRHECWSGLPFPSPGDLPDPGIEPRTPTLQADALPSEPPRKQAKNGKWKCQKLGTREGSK